MFNDITEVFDELRTNKTWQLVLIFIICLVGYKLLSLYVNRQNDKLKFIADINILTSYLSNFNNSYSPETEIQTLGQNEIKREVIFPPVNPLNPNCGSVYPLNRPSDEKRKEVRMDLMNMIHYNSNDDDTTNIYYRPKGMFVIP